MIKFKIALISLLLESCILVSAQGQTTKEQPYYDQNESDSTNTQENNKTQTTENKATTSSDTSNLFNWQKNRYFLSSSGYGLDAKQLVIRRTFSLMYAEYGISNHFSIAAGTELISTLFKQPLWFIKPKATTQLMENVNLSIGILEIGLKDKVYGTLGSASLTVGSPIRNITAGVLFDGAKKFQLNQDFTYTISAIYGAGDTDNQTYFIIENFINFDNTQASLLSMIGYRKQDNLQSLEGGLIFYLTPTKSYITPSPYISYSWNI